MSDKQTQAVRASFTRRAQVLPDPGLADAEPGSGIPFVLVNPGVKRDGQDPTWLPWRLESYRKNPVILPFHDAASFPIGAGSIDEVPFGRQVGLNAMAYFDMQDPVGALADSKYRRGFMRAVSLGWDPLDQAGIPTRISRQRPVANEVAEFSIVAIGGDPDALIDPGRAQRERIHRFLRGIGRQERDRTFDFLTEAQDALRGAAAPEHRADYDQRAQLLEHLLRALKLCDGEACQTLATHIVGQPGSAAAADPTPDPDRDPQPASPSPAEGETAAEPVPEDPEAQASGEGEAGRGGVPDEAEAEDAAQRRRQVAMAAMYRAIWVDDAEDADDDEREALYKSLLPEYRRLRLTRPAWMKARLVASLSLAQRRLLLPNGEVDLMNQTRCQGCGCSSCSGEADDPPAELETPSDDAPELEPEADAESSSEPEPDPDPESDPDPDPTPELEPPARDTEAGLGADAGPGSTLPPEVRRTLAELSRQHPSLRFAVQLRDQADAGTDIDRPDPPPADPPQEPLEAPAGLVARLAEMDVEAGG